MGCAASAEKAPIPPPPRGQAAAAARNAAAAARPGAAADDNKDAFVRSWVDDTSPADDAKASNNKSNVARAASRLSRVASKAARSNVSFTAKGQGPQAGKLVAADPRRQPLDFSDPAYSVLVRRTPLKQAYDVDVVEEDRGDLGTFRLMADSANGDTYTCRTVRKALLEGPEELAALQAEVEAMHALSTCPGAIRLHAVYEDDEAFHLVLDHCPIGDLFDRVMEQGSMPEADAAVIMKQVLTTVCDMHKNKGLMHRDISLENVFVMEAPPARSKQQPRSESDAASTPLYKVKLGGFASCAFFTPGQKFNDIVGSSYYIGPEVLRRSHGCEADIWSAGVLLYMMLCGKPPFSGEDEMEIFTSVMSSTPEFTGPNWSSVSQEAIDAVQQMLNFEPDLRTSPELMLLHPWIQKYTTAPAPPALSPRPYDMPAQQENDMDLDI